MSCVSKDTTSKFVYEATTDKAIQTHILKDNLQMRHEYLAIQSLAQSHKFNSVNFTYQPSTTTTKPSKEYKSDQNLSIFTYF